MAENKRVTGDYTITTLGAGSKVIINSDLIVTGDIDFENVANRIYVAKSGDDAQDGLSWEKAKLTIKAACEAAQNLLDTDEFTPNHVSILVASGDYTEDCPVTIPEGCALLGDNLRSVTVRPANPRSNVFYVSSNSYVWGITVRDHQLYPSALDITPEGYAGYNGQGLPRSIDQVGFAFSFTPGSIIRVSPYIQNCSSISGRGVFGNPDYVPGGGGILVDPSVCEEGNRINSIVLDAFTQINQGGIGCKVVGRGYMQLVSFFVNFCQFGVLCVDGGHVTLLNSNCSFGNYAFWAEGSRTLVREPDEILDVDVITEATDTIVATNEITLNSDDDISLNLPIQFGGINSGPVLNNIVANQVYYIKEINGLNIKLSETIAYGEAGPVFVLTGSNETGGNLHVRKAFDEVVPYSLARTIIQGNRATYQNDVVTAVNLDVTANYTTTCTATTAGTNVVTCADTTKLFEGMSIRFSGTLFGGANINDYTTYYVLDILNATDFTISETYEGSEVALTTAAGSMTVAFYYDQGKCKRDVGYLVDAIINDLATESLIYSRRAGAAYWDGVTSLIQGQIGPTVNAVDILAAEIVSDLGGDIAENSVLSSINSIKDFMRNGPNRPFETARKLIQGNNNWLASEVSAWIANEIADGPGSSGDPIWDGFTYTAYMQDKCERDVKYVLDAVVSDLITGTGRATRTAGNAYYRGVIDIPLPNVTSVFEFAAEDLMIGRTYTITVLGNTDWASITGIAGTYSVGDSITVINYGSGTGRAEVEQTAQTQAAFNELKNLVLAILNDSASGLPDPSARDYFDNFEDADFANEVVTRYFNTLTDIIYNGPDPDDLLLSPMYEPSRTLLTLNKEFIQKEAVAYVNDELSLTSLCTASSAVTDNITCVRTNILAEGLPITFEGSGLDSSITAGTTYYVYSIVSATEFKISATADLATFVALTGDLTNATVFTYNQVKCERDIGYLVDAIISDLATNSQEATLMAGNAYWRGAASVSEEFVRQIPDTLKAIDYVKRLALKVVNSDITPPIGNPAVLEPRDLQIDSTGSYLYVLGGVGPKVYQFAINTPWDTSDITFLGSFDVGNDEFTPQGMYLGNSGTELYVIGTGAVDSEADGRKIFQYTLSTPYDVTTATSTASFDLNTFTVGNGYVVAPSGIYFVEDGFNDGLIMFIVGSSDATVYKYALGVAWDITSLTFNPVNGEYYLGNEDNFVTGITFDTNGSHMYVTGATNDVIVDYELATAWSLASADVTLVETVNISDYEEEITGIQFKTSDGSQLYIIGLTSDSVISFNLLNNWDISSLEFLSSTPTGYFSTPYQNAVNQDFVATVVSTTAPSTLTCDPTYGTFYIAKGNPIKFTQTSSGTPLFGGIVEGQTYYIREVINSTDFTISETEDGLAFTGITTAGPSSMAVAPTGASAAFEITKNFNSIIRIIRDGAEPLDEDFGSLVEATGYTLSYAGAGIDYTKLSKGQGGSGIADPNKYTIELDGGRVFITATDEKGDFYVGRVTPAEAGETARPLFRINQQTGSIDGRAFYQSIFGFVAPFVLALTRRK